MEIKSRSYQAEMLDDDQISPYLLHQNLKELAIINKWLGGHDVSITGLNKLVTNKDRLYRVLDIGCGGGDTLKSLAKWARKQNLKIAFVGLDIKNDAIEFAKNSCADYPNIEFICADYRDIPALNLDIDIFTAALFCHHFNENQLKELMKIMAQSSKIGFFINDLHRNWLAYYSIKLLTRCFSKSPLVINDAPLSVKRGFIKNDWLDIIGDLKATVEWKWAFRHLVVYKK